MSGTVAWTAVRAVWWPAVRPLSWAVAQVPVSWPRAPFVSWPALCRPSTTSPRAERKAVDGRDKRGHDTRAVDKRGHDTGRAGRHDTARAGHHDTGGHP